MTTRNGDEQRCILITGGLDTGKSSLAERTVEEMRSRGMRVGGIITAAEYRRGRKRAYRAVDLTDGRQHLLLDDQQELGGGRLGRFSLSAEGFAWAEAQLRRALEEGAEVICLDEAGPLEQRGGGYAKVLEELLRRHRGLLILVVRDSAVEDFERLARSHGWQTERRFPGRSAEGR